MAAVGLRALDGADGMAVVSVDLLSPRHLGGWECQLRAAEAAQILQQAGCACETERMEYLPESDCFRVGITARVAVEPGEEGWIAAGGLEICMGGQPVAGVRSFRAVRDLGRRLLGSMGRGEAVGITAGSGGWTIELVQTVQPEQTETEPFELTVRQGRRTERFGGCCWNETVVQYGTAGRTMTRRGFALTREVLENG